MATRAVFLATLITLTTAGRSVAIQTVRYTDETGREVVRRCQPTEWPKQLPALDAVADSAAIWAVLATVPPDDTSALLLSVVYRESGPPSVRLVEPQVPTPGAVRVAEGVAPGLRPAASPPRPAGAVRLRLRAHPAIAAIVERSVFCPPEVIPGGRVGMQTTRVMLGPGDRMPPQGRLRVDAELTIDDAGIVTQVDLLGSSGIRELDEVMTEDLRKRVYRPALLDGLRIAGWDRTVGRKMRL